MVVSKQRPRTIRRLEERALLKLVRDKERLFTLSTGGAREHPYEVTSTAVIEVRVEALPCPQCGGRFRIREHSAPASGLRQVDVTCRQCGAPRTLWFRLVSDEPN